MVYLRKLHKWIGLLIGLQVLLWLLSGLVISLLDPLKVSGRQWSNPVKTEVASLPDSVLLEPHELPAAYTSDATGISLTSKQGQPFYRVRRHASDSLINAVDGTISTTSKTDAEKIASQDFTGDGEITSITRGLAPDMETRSSTGEYWKVSFSDPANTAIYISVATGEILERRNSYWRIRDFFWMLHIMDYSGRQNFNNALIISVVLIAIWLGVSGFLMLFGSFRWRDFYFLNVFGKKDYAVITMMEPDWAAPARVKLRKGSNLFLSLATHGINLPSICGGGGECGRCRVQMEMKELPAATDIERKLIPKRLREKGFRLACQHEVTSNTTLTLAKGLNKAKKDS
jgi:ferredoxin